MLYAPFGFIVEKSIQKKRPIHEFVNRSLS